MDDDKKNLYVFGHGLALIIPFFVMTHAITIPKHPLSVIGFIAVFIMLLVVISKMEKTKIFYFACLIFCYQLIFREWTHHGWPPIPIIFLVLSIIIGITTSVNVEQIRPLYKKWMILAHFIGTVISGTVLCLLYYFVFGPVGIVLRLLRKDLLDQRLDRQKDSYWVERESKDFDQQHYQNQF